MVAHLARPCVSCPYVLSPRPYPLPGGSSPLSRPHAVAHGFALGTGALQRATSKRSLKSGELDLRDALAADCWQEHRVLEILGYALIGRPTDRSALVIAANLTPQIGHHTLVGDLSAAQCTQLCLATRPPRQGRVAHSCLALAPIGYATLLDSLVSCIS